jgi:DNA-binding MarR family transcriptional regulator
MQLLLAHTKGMKTQLDDSRNSLWRLFLTTYVRLIDCIEEEFKQADLPSFEWYDVLWALKQAPDYRMRLHELAQSVLLSRSNLTRLVDRLEKAGLVSRESCSTDRRGALAVLTDAGIEMQQKMWAVYAPAIEHYFGQYLEDAEVESFTHGLKKILVAQQTNNCGGAS